LTPSACAWSLRWFKEDVDEWFPGVFGIPPLENHNYGFKEIMVGTILAYLAWWVPYIFWWVVQGKHMGWNNGHEYDTIYSWNAGNWPSIWKNWFGYDKDDTKRFLPFLKYMMCHLLMGCVFTVMSWATFKYYYLSCAYISIVLARVSYLGSVRYYKMMTRYYESGMTKKLEKYVRQAKKDNLLMES